MQLTDRRFRCDDFFALSFRKALSRKSDVLEVLVEESCVEEIDKEFD